MNTFLNRVVFWLFWLFCIAYLIAVIGVVFDVHPPFSVIWAGSALLILEGTLLAIALMDVYGPRGLLVVLVIALLAYGIEALGVNTGFPFGTYRYTNVLSPRVAGGVPLAVIFVWLMIIIVVRSLTVRPPLIMGGRLITGILFGAGFATLLDLILEPVAFHLEHYWEWLAPGQINFYGTPWLNFVAWFCVAFVLLLITDVILLPAASLLNLTSFWGRLSLNVPTWLYYANVLMFGLADLTHGYYIAAGLALLAGILPIVLSSFYSFAALPVLMAIDPDQLFEEQDQTFQRPRKRVKKTKKVRKKKR